MERHGVASSEYTSRPDAKGYLKVTDALRRWDPIGVCDQVPDEYDSYAPVIVRLLDRRVDAKGLAAVLHSIAKEQMGIESDRTRDDAIAEELVRFWRTWGGHRCEDGTCS